MRERDKDTQPLPVMHPPATRDPKFDRDPKFNEFSNGAHTAGPEYVYAPGTTPEQVFQRVDHVIDRGIDAFTRGFFAFFAAVAAALGVFMLAANFSPWMHESGLSIIPAGYVFWAVSRRIVNGKWG